MYVSLRQYISRLFALAAVVVPVVAISASVIALAALGLAAAAATDQHPAGPNARYSITGHQTDGLLNALAAHRPLASVAVSPSGRFLTGLVAEGEDQQLYVWSADNPVVPDEPAHAGDWTKLPFVRREIGWLAWVGPDQLVIAVNARGLFVYDAAAADLRPLLKDADMVASLAQSELRPILISPMVTDANKLLVQWETSGAKRGFPSVFEIDISAGTAREIQAARPPIVRWWATSAGEIKVGESYRAREHVIYALRDGGWRAVHQHDYFDDPAFDIVGLSRDGSSLYITSEVDADQKSLWRYSLESFSLVEQLASHERFDISSAIFDPASEAVVGARYSDLMQEQIIIDDAFEEKLSAARQAIGLNPNDLSDSLWLSDASRDGKRTLYQLRSEKHPIRYFLHDGERDQYQELVPNHTYRDFHRTSAAWIDLPRKRGQMQAILSVPKGPDGKLKLTGKGVVLIHGGPVRRSSQRYHRFLSWLTAHGFVVLQPNFRGSDGYGAEWRRAGHREWGADMQDDIETAAKWLIREGYVEADSLCAVGGSYGGYSALLGILNDADLFQCAVSLNGVTSVPHLVSYLAGQRFSLLSVPRIQGNLSNRTLRRRSPLYNARRLKRPALLLHSTNDANVPFEHGQLMAAVLKQHRKDYDFIILPGAEHRLGYPRYRKTYYESALAFLEKHIGERRGVPDVNPSEADTDG